MPRSSGPAILRSDFLPPYALQGQEFSGHILWEPTAELVDLLLDPGSGIAIKHLYNVDGESARDQGDSGMKVERVAENGYLGFVLESIRFEEPEVVREVAVTCQFRIGGQVNVVDRRFRIRLFRPLLTAPATLGALKAEIPRGDYCLRIKDPIQLTNQGAGTALLLVVATSVEKSTISDYLLTDEVKKTYLGVINERFTGLKSDFPKYQSYLDTWLQFFAAREERSEDKLLKWLEKLAKESKEVERSEPDLLQDVADVLGDALLAVFSLDQRFKAWAQSLESTLDRKVVLLNPSMALTIPAGGLELDLEFRYFDLLGHPYPPLRLPKVRIDAAVEGILPMFELVTTVSPTPPSEDQTKSRPGG